MVKITGKGLIPFWIERIEGIQSEMVYHGTDQTEAGNKAYEFLDEARNWLSEIKLKKVI